MSAVIDLLSTDLIQRVGWSLVHFLWQGVAIAGLLWLVLRGLARRGPRVRYAVACLTLVLMAAAPVATFFVVPPAAQHAQAVGNEGDEEEQTRSLRIPSKEPGFVATLDPAPGDVGAGAVLPADGEEARLDDLGSTTAADIDSASPTQSVGPASWLRRLSSLSEPVIPSAVALWLAGVLACSVWHVGGWLKIQRLRRGATPLASGSNEQQWRRAADRMAGPLRIRRTVQLLKLTGTAASDVAGPVVVGVLRPAVMIPAAVLTGLTPNQIEAILAHELAHIRRHDYLVNLLQAFVETLLFFHPAVWWVSSRVRAEREHCCDDLAVLAIGDRDTYISSLAALAEVVVAQKPGRPTRVSQRLSPANRIVPGAKTNLLSRIRRLLGVKTDNSTRWPSALAGILLLGVLLFGVALYGCVGDPIPQAQPNEPVDDLTEVSPDALVAVSYGEWSEVDNGLQARLILKRKSVSNGTPLISTYLELKNVASVGNAMKVEWASRQMTFRVADHEGKQPPPAMGPYSGLAFLLHDLTLPHDSSLVFDITAGGSGIQANQAARIDMGPTKTWFIPHDDRKYTLAGTLEIAEAESRTDDGHWRWHGKLELPPVRVPLKTPAIEQAALGRLIDRLGERMNIRPNNLASEAAADSLSLIDDERVIPWYVKAVASDSSSLRSRALDRLRQFESDAALEGIRIGMNTQAEDFQGGSASLHLANRMANSVRHTAAYALAFSPHPKAKDLLLTMRGDPYEAVRIVVVQTFGEMDTPQALQLLKEMSQDSDETVRSEAKRYLALRKRTQAKRQDLKIVSWIEVMDQDDLPAGLYCRVPLYSTTDHPGARWVYKHTVGAVQRGGGDETFVFSELSARLSGTYTAKGTLEVAEQFVQGDTITIRLRYIDEDKDIARYRESGTRVMLSGNKQSKSVYLWGGMPKDLSPGTYTVNVELDEYERKDGKLVIAPATKPRQRERLTSTFTVPGP